MKFENTFVVSAPIEEVWDTLMDVQRVAPCMPGAEVLERVDEDTYKVAVKVRLGPMSMQYRGQLEVVSRDPATRQATMRAKAKEARGQGTADAQIQMGLEEEAGGTRGSITTEMQLSGRAAAMGQGVIADVAARLIEMFAANLAKMVGGGGEETPEAESPAAPRAEPRAEHAEVPPLESALPIAELAAGVIAGRLSNPRTLLIATAGLAVLSGAIGYAIGRSR